MPTTMEMAMATAIAIAMAIVMTIAIAMGRPRAMVLAMAMASELTLFCPLSQTLVADEIHLIKGKGTAFWIAVRLWLARSTAPTYLLGLSGTPLQRESNDVARIVGHLWVAGQG